MSPLCHTSVSKWSLAAGVKDLHDPAKIERCAKVAGEVVYIVTTALNEFLDEKDGRAGLEPVTGDTALHQVPRPTPPVQKARKWNQQGHMECLMCHEDHTA